MYPILCKIGPLTIYSYGTALALAFLTCIFFINRDSKKFGFDADVIINLCFWLLVSGIIGARILYCLLNIDFFAQNPLEILMLQHGGLVWYGGLGAAALIGAIYLKKNKFPVLKTMDFLVPYSALGHAIGRLGCFLNGCCFGKPAENFGIYFPVYNARLIPTQLYESGLLIVLFLILKNLRNKPHKQGEVFVFYVLSYSMLRFLMEFLRGDSQPIFIGLTIFQIISLFLILISAYGIIYLRSSTRR